MSFTTLCRIARRDRSSLSPQRGEGMRALPLKEEYFVIFLCVQCKYFLLSHWGCNVMHHLNSGLWLSSKRSVNIFRAPIWSRGIAAAPPISCANAN